MTNVTPIDEAKKFVRESYLATLGAGQLVLDKAKDLSSSATRYARGGRSSVDSTVRDLVKRGEKVVRTVRRSDIARRTGTQARTARTQAAQAGRQTASAVVALRDAVAGSFGSTPTETVSRPRRPAARTAPRTTTRTTSSAATPRRTPAKATRPSSRKRG